MFINLNQNNIPLLYKWYQKGYEVFFRHFDDFLNLDEFVACLSTLKSLVIEENGEVIGLLMLRVYSKPKVAEVSILITKDVQRMGLGLAKMKEIGEYLFNNGIERIVCLVSQDDKHTVDICEKGGFEVEGVYINSCKYLGEYHNEVRFGMSKEKFIELYK